MRDAAVFLFYHSSRNWARGLLRRLKSPRYAVAILLGVGYLALILLGQHQGTGAAFPARAVGVGGAVLLLALVAKWWVFGADRLALAFTPAEIQFLFPAPVRRSGLLGYKLARAQRIILPNVLIWTFILRRGGEATLAALPYALTMWAFFSTVSLHRLGVALTRDSVIEHGRSGLRRLLPAAVAFGVVVAIVWLSLPRIHGALNGAGSEDPLGAVGVVTSAPPLSWLIWVFRIPLWPLEAHDLREWLARFPVALALVGLHVLWVVRSDRAFEEAAIEASFRRAELLDRLRKQGAQTNGRPHRARRWILLARTGHPVSAIIWKNVTRLIRTLSPAIPVLLLLLLAGTAGLALSQTERGFAVLSMIGALALAWTAVLGIFGPNWVRNDLRGELAHLALLRTWPLSGATLMAGQVLSSALVLTLSEFLLGGLGVLALHLGGEALPLGWGLFVIAPVAALVLVGLNLIALCIQNAAALLFPSWVRTDLRPGGIEQAGQHLLTAGASLILLFVAVLGPGIVGAGIGYLLWEPLAEWALIPAGLAAAAGLALEVLLLLDWLGTRFERIDPTAL